MTAEQSRQISGIGEIAGSYDGFVLDIWGTVHDGGAIYPGVIDALQRLRDAGKGIVFLSNSPRTPPVLEDRLNRLGLAPSLRDAIVSSGGETRLRLSDPDDPELALFEGPVWQTGPDRFPDTLPPDLYPSTRDSGAANWVLNAGPNRPEDTLDAYDGELRACAARRLPMLCANPDIRVMHGDAIHLCAGALAQRYEEYGGTVVSIGKPLPGVFHRCLSLPVLARPRRVLVIGDNLETDILGANRAGLDSLLLAGGIHELLDGSGAVRSRELALLERRFGARAELAAPRLVW